MEAFGLAWMILGSGILRSPQFYKWICSGIAPIKQKKQQ
jgi:hypothetical protein